MRRGQLRVREMIWLWLCISGLLLLILTFVDVVRRDRTNQRPAVSKFHLWLVCLAIATMLASFVWSFLTS